MRLKLNYREAVRLLTAFLGSNIEIHKPSKLTYGKCQVFRMSNFIGFKYDLTLICEADSWEELLNKLLPEEVFNGRPDIDFSEIGLPGRLYKFRSIGRLL